jgi:tellurium resistance protein TerD
MSISLSKGEGINFSKEAPGIKSARIALGWDINPAFDLDVSIFMLGSNGKIPNEKYFVFYNNLESQDGSVKFMEDGKTGKGAEDYATLEIDLTKVNSSIQEIVIVVTIYDVDGINPTFSQVKNSFMRIYDTATKQEIAKYELDEDSSEGTAMEFCKLSKKEGDWIFQAVGQGSKLEIDSFVDKYAS